MKVYFYAGVFARMGGIEEFTRDLALALLQSGAEVGIICASLRNPVLDELQEAGARIIRLPFFWGCRWNLPDLLLLPLALATMGRADLVIHQKPFAAWFYRWFPRRPKQVFLTAYRPMDQFESPERIRDFFSPFDEVITQTESFKAEILEAGVGVPVHVLPLIPPPEIPVEADAVQEGTDALRIGMMGRLEPQKNPAFALEICEKIAQAKTDGQSVVLNIYGSGMLEKPLAVQAETMKARVVFHGRYQRQEIPEIIAENDLFMITSESEGQCIVALEILSGGRPLMATPAGALPDILSDSVRGCVIPYHDAAGAAEQIRTWMEQQAGWTPQAIRKSYERDYDRQQVEAAYVELLGRING